MNTPVWLHASLSLPCNMCTTDRAEHKTVQLRRVFWMHSQRVTPRTRRISPYPTCLNQRTTNLEYQTGICCLHALFRIISHIQNNSGILVCVKVTDQSAFFFFSYFRNTTESIPMLRFSHFFLQSITLSKIKHRFIYRPVHSFLWLAY